MENNKLDATAASKPLDKFVISDGLLQSIKINIVEKTDETIEGAPTAFRLVGAGWGHGVGLCQVGAAVMGAEGYAYRDILLHYYKEAQIERKYE